MMIITNKYNTTERKRNIFEEGLTWELKENKHDSIIRIRPWVANMVPNQSETSNLNKLQHFGKYVCLSLLTCVLPSIHHI